MFSDLQTFLEAHAKLESVEFVLVDPCGVVRGKWAPAAALRKAFSDGVNFPLSLHGLDIWGNEVAATHLHISSGDLDGFCVAVPTSLSAVPWGGEAPPTQAANATNAQVILQTKTPDHEPFGGCARTVLEQTIQRLATAGLHPVTALELEFHLLKPQDDWRNGLPEIAALDFKPDAQFMYGLEALAENSAFFADLRRAAQWADLPIDTLVKEAGPGQYEVNLNHRSDTLRAADDVILLKRAVRECARKHDLFATFMAKPFVGQPGNGMHIHTSLLDSSGSNIFAGPEGKKKRLHAVAGLVGTMEEATLAFVNSMNGFRRMAPGSYAPTRANWGENNRSVAVRLPASPDEASRIEHRVSGADANPYIVLACTLQAMLDGLNTGDMPPSGLIGNAYDEGTPNRGRQLPGSLSAALSRFRASEFTRRALGEQMHHILCCLKQAELNGFADDISPLELHSYL